MTDPAPAVDALLFDMFGTVVDWRGGFLRDGPAIGAAAGVDVDWGSFADAWREEYRPALDRVRRGEVPWRNLDSLQAESLEALIDRFGLEGLSEADVDRLHHIWHRLDPWPDSIPGLRRLKPHHLIAPLSNGHVRLLTNVAKRAGIPWDLILSAELSRHYKPDEQAYLIALELLDLEPSSVMMVAAHEYDLKASREFGLRTAYIHRPYEWGPEAAASVERPDEGAYDVVVDSLVELADALGAPPIA